MGAYPINILDRLDVQFALVHDCIRACVYADHIMRRPDKKDAWWSIVDICYSDAVISWNQIFGTLSQESHWKNFLKDFPQNQQSKLNPFSKELIAEYLDIEVQQWVDYHQSLQNFRNKRLVHYDHKHEQQELPNITWALHSCCFYRSWLLAFCDELKTAGIDLNISTQSHDEMLKLFRQQITEVCP